MERVMGHRGHGARTERRREVEGGSVAENGGTFGRGCGLRGRFIPLMKNKLLVGTLVFVAAVGGVFAQNRNASVPEDRTVMIESENRLLARSYVQAFGALVRPPYTLTMQKENIGYVLEDVRAVKEVGGLLIVEVGRGFNYVVNPKDIVAISDGPAIKADR